MSTRTWLRDWRYRRRCGRAAHLVARRIAYLPSEVGTPPAPVELEYVGLVEVYWAAYILSEWPAVGLLVGVPRRQRVEAAIASLTVYLSARVLSNHAGSTRAVEEVDELFAPLLSAYGLPEFRDFDRDANLRAADALLSDRAGDLDVPPSLGRLVEQAVGELDVPDRTREDLLVELRLRFSDYAVGEIRPKSGRYV